MRTISAAQFPYAALVCLALILGTAALLLSPKSLTANAPKQTDFVLPELYKINTVSFQASYKCNWGGDLTHGYQMTPLFVSRFSQDQNAPDLLFFDSCQSAGEFRAALARDSMTLVEDMGQQLKLEDVNAAVALSTLDSRSFHFERSIRVSPTHTYVVLLNDSDRRGLIALTVMNYIQNQRLDLRYAVLDYQFLNIRSQSPGFAWGKNPM